MKASTSCWNRQRDFGNASACRTVRTAPLLLALVLIAPAKAMAAPVVAEVPSDVAPALPPGVPPLPEWGAQPVGAMPRSLYDRALEVRDHPLHQRIELISQWFLGLPHEHDPLGEGAQEDADPLTRYDLFDCLTFVEEVLALALAGDPAHATEVRLDLRYDGRADYAARRHFMELQWLPDNVERGYLVDTTASYGDVVHREREVDLAMWRNWADRPRFAYEDAELPIGTMALDILPLERALEVADKIRP